MLTETGYRQALGLLDGTDLQRAVRQVNDALKKLAQFVGKQAAVNQFVNDAATADKTIRGRKGIKRVSIYQRFYLDKLAVQHKTWISSKIGQYNAIEYLLLFSRTQRVQLRCTAGSEGYRVSRSETDDFIVDGPAPVDVVVYDLFYWRTNRDDIGVGKLRLTNDWQQAELVYHYRAVGPGRERSFLSGPAHWCGASNLYLHLQDTTPPTGKAGPTHVFLSLFIPEPTDKRQYIAGVFASANRDTHDPVCGMVLLQRNDTNANIDQSDFVRLVEPDRMERVPHNIPDNVFHAVSNTRVKVAPQPILASLQIPYTQEIRMLSGFAGTYQAYQPQPADCLRLMKLVIEPGGRAILTRKNSVETGYVDYCAGVLILKFAYQPETASYRFYCLLEKGARAGDLTGVYTGLDNENIVSTRLYLQQMPAGRAVTVHEQSHVGRLFLNRLAASAPDVVAFLTDSRLTTTDAFWAYRLNQLASADLKLSKSVARPQPVGQYNAFFLAGSHADGNGADQVQLVRMPLLIRENDAVAQFDGKTILGDLSLNDEGCLSIRFVDPQLDAELAIEPIEPAYAELSHQPYARLTGTIRREAGSGTFVLCLETDATSLAYGTYDQLTEMLHLDRRYAGLISFLLDTWTQTTHEPVVAHGLS